MDIKQAKRLAVIAGAGAVIAMGAFTAALTNSEAQAQPSLPNVPATYVPAITQGPAPAKPVVPSAVPRHVQSWKCYDIFTSQCSA
jgi:hypothetical protein